VGEVTSSAVWNAALWTSPYLVTQTQDPPQLLTLSSFSVPSSAKVGLMNCSILHTASKASACIPQLLFQASSLCLCLSSVMACASSNSQTLSSVWLWCLFRRPRVCPQPSWHPNPWVASSHQLQIHLTHPSVSWTWSFSQHLSNCVHCIPELVSAYLNWMWNITVHHHLIKLRCLKNIH